MNVKNGLLTLNKDSHWENNVMSLEYKPSNPLIQQASSQSKVENMVG